MTLAQSLQTRATRLVCWTLFVASQAQATARSELNVAVTSCPHSVHPGDPVHIELLVANPDQFSRNGVEVSLMYPEHLDILSTAITDGVCDEHGSNLTCQPLERVQFVVGTLGPGQGRAFSLLPIVSAGTPNGTPIAFNVEAVDDSLSKASDSIMVTVGETPAINLALLESHDPAAADDVLAYTLSYGVLSPNFISDGVLRLQIPPGATFVSATGGGVEAGGIVQWPIGPLGPGQSGEVRCTVQLDGPADGAILKAEAIIEDLASLASNGCDAATRVENGVPLEISLAAGPDPARPGESVGVELAVSNTGAFPVNGITARIRYPFGMGDLSTVIIDGVCTEAGSNLTCQPAERIVFEIGTLDAGEGRTFYLPPLVANTAAGSLAAFEAEAFAPGGIGRKTHTAFAISDQRPLQLALDEDRDPVSEGGQIVYTLTYALLASTSGVPDALLRMRLAPGTSFFSATQGGLHTDGHVEWTIGALSPGQGGQVQCVVQVSQNAGTIVEADAVLRNQETDDVVRCESATRVQNDVSLDLALGAGPNPARAGESVALELTTTNSGAFPLLDTKARLRFPPGLTDLPTAIIDPICQEIGSNLTCQPLERAVFDLGTLNAGEGRSFRLPPELAAVPAGTLLTFHAEVSAGSGQARKTQTSLAASDNRVLELTLLESRDPVEPGGLIVYTASYGMLSSGDGIHEARLEAALPAHACYVDASHGGVLQDGSVQWSLGPLAPGGGGERLLTLRAQSGGPGFIRAQASIEDPSKANSRVVAETVTRVQDQNPLLVEVMAGPNPASPGQMLDVSFTVTNASSIEREGVQILARYPTGLQTIATSDFDGGTCTEAGSNLTCQPLERIRFDAGSLLAGSQATFTMPPLVGPIEPAGRLISFEAYASDVTGFRSGSGDVVKVAPGFDAALGDGVIDWTEAPLLAVCLGGPASGDCALLDFNEDSKIDLLDAAAFQNRFGGICIESIQNVLN